MCLWHRDRRVLFVVGALLALCLSMTARVAYAAPDVTWVQDSPANHIANTTLYITHLGADNATITNVSGPVYVDPADNCVKVRGGDLSPAHWVVTYRNAGYDVNGKDFDVRLTCDLFYTQNEGVPSEGHTVYLHEGMQAPVEAAAGIRFRLELLDHSGRPVDGTFGMFFSDVDIVHGDVEDEFTEGIEFVRNCGGPFWAGEAMGADVHWDNNGGLDEHGNHTFCPGQRLRIYERDGKSIVHATHTCGGQNDSSFACIGRNGAEFVWRAPGGAGGFIGLIAATTVYPDLAAPTKSANTAKVASDGSATFTVTQTFPDVSESNKPSSIQVFDTFANCLDVSRATYSVTRVDGGGVSHDVTSNWSKSVSGQTLTLSARNTGHGFATQRHAFLITVPVKRGYDFCDGQLSFNGVDLRLSNVASVRVVPGVGSVVTKSTNQVVVDITGSLTPSALLQKGDLDLGIGKAQGDMSLSGATYKLEYWPSWSIVGSPTATGTWTTGSDGKVSFLRGSWPYGTTYGSLPFGTYRVTETSAPSGYGAMGSRTFQIRSSNAGGAMLVTKGAGWDGGLTTAETGLVSIEPSVVRGSVRTRVVDADMVTAQGDAYIAGAKVSIWNASANPVVVGGVTYGVGDRIGVITVGEDGYAVWHGLPYGTYRIEQDFAPSGYTARTVKPVASVRGTGVTDAANVVEDVWRGSTDLRKVDADSGTSVPQGDAVLAGAVFDVTNDSIHDVVVAGERYVHGDVCWSGAIESDGFWRMAARTLPYGTYVISERTPPVGYRRTGVTLRFQVRADGEVVRTAL